MLICLGTEEECSFHTLIRQCSLHVSEQLKIPIEFQLKLPGYLMQVLKLNCGEKEICLQNPWPQNRLRALPVASQVDGAFGGDKPFKKESLEIS